MPRNLRAFGGHLWPRPSGRGHTPEQGLRCSGVVVDFEGLRAIDHVDLELASGEILGLIGPNGAGKTTLVNVLSGYQPPRPGVVSLDGRDITSWPTHRRARTGLVRTFQAVRLFGGSSVRENVEPAALAVGLGWRRAREETERVLSTLGLNDRRDEPAASLPYGDERMVGLARALAAKPRYLLLDEPAAGLNESETASLTNVLKELPGQFDCGVLVIEHDMRLILGSCHRVHVLDHGATIFVGGPDAVRTDPKVLEAYLGRHGAAA